MKEYNEKIPDPKEIEKEIGDFLTKKFGGSVRMVSPLVLPQEVSTEKAEKATQKEKKIHCRARADDQANGGGIQQQRVTPQGQRN